MKRYKTFYPKAYFDDIKDNHQQRVYDCIAFFNEIDLLKIRLEELNDVVDYFVLCEGTRTFSGIKKELFFKKNKKLFKKWEHKIIHVVAEMPKLNFLDKFFILLEKHAPRKIQMFLRKVFYNLIGGVSTYKLAEIGKRGVSEGLVHAQDDDIVMGIDMDEIPRAETIKKMRQALKKYRFVAFEQQNYRYFINGEVTGRKLPATRACYYKTFKKELKSKIDYLRTSPFLWRKMKPHIFGPENYYTIKNAGWHFSYLGGVDKIIKKFNSLEHPEDYIDELSKKEEIKKMIDKGIFPFASYRINYIPVDKTFPKGIFKNKKQWNQYIKKI